MTKRNHQRSSRKKGVLENRTNPHDCNLLCFGSNNPRVRRSSSYLGTANASYHSFCPTSRNLFWNVQPQIKALVSLCLPKHFFSTWESVFGDECLYADPSMDVVRFSKCSLPVTQKVANTPLCWLEHALRISLGPNHTLADELTMSDGNAQGPSLFGTGEGNDCGLKSRAMFEDMYLLEVVLNCQLRAPSSRGFGDDSSVVRMVQAYSYPDMRDAANAKYCSAVVMILPNVQQWSCGECCAKGTPGIWRRPKGD